MNAKPHFSSLPLHCTCMAMWLLTQGDSDILTPEGYTNIDAFSTPDDLESYSPIDDPFMKYAEDPPVLIAWVP